MKLQMRFFSHVELAHDVEMRRYNPVNILFIHLTKEKHAILIIIFSVMVCNICSAFFGIAKKSDFKRMHDAAYTEISKIERSWYWAFIKLTTFYLHSVFVGELYENLDCTSLNKVSCARHTKIPIVR